MIEREKIMYEKNWHVGMKPGPMVYGEQGEQIADCRMEFMSASENGANARLIAAAPDLLRVADLVLQFATIETNPRLLEAAQAAINKALS